MASPSLQMMAGIRHVAAGQRLHTRGTTLTRVALHNFKGHADLRLDLGKITVLIGPTNSGKSTVLQALNLLRSALQTRSLGVLNGSQEYGSFEDVVTRRDRSLDVGIDIDGHQMVCTSRDGDILADFSYGVSFGMSLGALHHTQVRATVDARRDPPPPHKDGVRIDHEYGEGTADKSTVSGPWTEGSSPVSARADSGLAPRIDASLGQSRMARTFAEVFRSGMFFQSLLDELWHVPFSRVVTSYALPPECAKSILSPNRTQGAASLLSYISSDPALQKKISDMLQEMGLKQIVTRNVTLGDKNTNLALDFVEDGGFNSIVHEGSGPNQLVNMLAVLAHSPRGAVVTIEEPEIHLDPAAQARLMGILVRQATEEDKQIIFTTHSDHLLFPLLAYVAKDGCPLDCSDVAMHYFNTDESGRVAGAERLAINKHGQIRGGLKGFSYADGLAMSEIMG